MSRTSNGTIRPLPRGPRALTLSRRKMADRGQVSPTESCTAYSFYEREGCTFEEGTAFIPRDSRCDLAFLFFLIQVKAITVSHAVVQSETDTHLSV